MAQEGHSTATRLFVGAESRQPPSLVLSAEIIVREGEGLTYRDFCLPGAELLDTRFSPGEPYWRAAVGSSFALSRSPVPKAR
jgi:hypothetical protein